MPATPWGHTDGLRARRLAPGPSSDPAKALRSQRERLFAATVAVVAEKGYEATRVEDLLVLAGVSRNAFYKLFANKRACFLAALEEIEGFAKAAVLDVFERTSGEWDERLAAMLDALAAALVAQPAMARVAWVEVYAAGPEAVAIVERVDGAVEDIVCRALKHSPERAGMPRDIVRAVVGAVRKMVYTRVREDRIDELPVLMPELFVWMQGYRTPPARLRRPRRVPPELAAPRLEPADARERILQAVADLVAEKGYPEMAITEIAARASVSLTTFYAHFDGKEAAFLETLADAQQRVLEATIPVFTSAPDWEHGVVVAGQAFLGFLATHPAIAQLGGVGVWATSTAALELRAQGMAVFSALLDPGFQDHPETVPVAREAIGASIDALLFATLRHKGADRLFELWPTGAFIILAPFLGSERACEVTNATAVELS
jgi:AcrR family transcriptional regulator